MDEDRRLAWIKEARGFFSGWDDTSLRSLASSAELRSLEPGEVLWHQNDAGTFALIVSGRFDIWRDETMIDMMHPGRVLGISALVGNAHTAEVRAGTGGRCLVWRTAEIREVLENPRVMLTALVEASRLVGRLNDELALYRARPRSVRVLAWHLVHLVADSKAERPVIGVEQHELATRCGMHLSTVNKEIQRLCREKVLDNPSQQGLLTVLDRARLQRIARGTDPLAEPKRTEPEPEP